LQYLCLKSRILQQLPLLQNNMAVFLMML